MGTAMPWGTELSLPMITPLRPNMAQTTKIENGMMVLNSLPARLNFLLLMPVMSITVGVGEVCFTSDKGMTLIARPPEYYICLVRSLQARIARQGPFKLREGRE